jgi:TorA maturation chaperone TorD
LQYTGGGNEGRKESAFHGRFWGKQRFCIDAPTPQILALRIVEVTLSEIVWTPNDGDWETTLTGEMLMCGLLAKILLSIPERDWIDPLIRDDVFSETPFGAKQMDILDGQKKLTEWSAIHRDGISEQGLKDVKVDYTRLFTGMRKLPVVPWESVYFSDERLVFQESTLKVRSWYRRYGLESIDLYKEPDDHVGLEISFVGHLAKLALTALQQGDSEEVGQKLNAQREFLGQHLILWAPLWSSLMIEYARTSFYHGIALLTRGMMLELATIYELKIPEYS